MTILAAAADGAPEALAAATPCTQQEQTPTSISSGGGLPERRPGSLSWRLWCGAEAVAMQSLHHPFVQGMATGALSKPAFQHYLVQDYVYLQYFARAYELALQKCDGHGTEVREAIKRFLDEVQVELQLHRGYAASWDVDLDSAQAAPATKAYTDFLIEVAEDPNTGVEQVFAAMTPCARLYGYLACQLAEQHPNWRDSPYARWIETYSGEEYLSCPALMEKLLDAMEGRTDYGTLSRLYGRAMQLELEFFAASV